MSTKSTLSFCSDKGSHKLNWHIYREMHQPEKTTMVELSCSTCYCHYDFLIDEHLGLQLVEIMEEAND